MGTCRDGVDHVGGLNISILLFLILILLVLGAN